MDSLPKKTPPRASLAIVGLFVLLSAQAFASPIECIPPAETFGVGAGSRVHEKKLSLHEFKGLPIQPSGSPVLTKGTELNVLVDLGCMRDPKKGPRSLQWLKSLKKEVHQWAAWREQRSFQWRLERDWDFLKLQETVEDEPCIDLVSPDGRFETFSRSGDPAVKEQSHLDWIGFADAMEAFKIPMLVRPQVSIAIIDTGVDFRHEDLRLNRWTNRQEVANNGIDDDRNGYIDDFDGYNFSSKSSNTGPEGDWPDNKHGTHVAGLAAGRFDNGVGGAGVDGLAKLMSLNVFGGNGITRSSILENAIRYAADQRVDIINLSLGGREYSRTMRSVLSYAVRKGSFIIAASGNEGVEICDNPSSFDFVSPAVYGRGIDGMITIGSVDTFDSNFSLFSNYSVRLVELSAPGAFTSQGRLTGLLSSTPKNTYGYLAGTSMAAPVVSGTAALVVTWLKAYGYSVSPARVEAIMKNGARNDGRMSSVVDQGRVLDLRALANYLRENYPRR